MKSKGFSLIELIVVIAIIGVLSTIAIPSYKDYLVKSRRNDAKNSIMLHRNNLEQFFYENDYTYCGYAPDPSQETVVLAQGLSDAFDSRSEYYNIKFKITSCTDDYKIIAYTKDSGNSQSDDNTCKWFVTSSVDNEEAYSCNSEDSDVDSCTKASTNSTTDTCWK